MRVTILIFLFISFSVSTKAQGFAADTVLQLMGKQFALKAITDNRQCSKEALEKGVKEIQRIEALISSYQSSSETSKINLNAGKKSVVVSDELFALIVRSEKISRLTKGAYDITFAPLYSVWNFKSQNLEFPSEDSIARYKNLVGFNAIELNRAEKSVYLTKRGMRIGFGSIGKGYAANRAKKVMFEAGAKSGFVNASGDILFWGQPLTANAWSVGIKHPNDKAQNLGWLKVNDMAVVTSGDYEQFLMLDGERYSHIIDPRSGYPVKNARSVTLICPDAELADALATAVSVLGPFEGIDLVNKLKNVECLMIDDKGEVYKSKRLLLKSER